MAVDVNIPGWNGFDFDIAGKPLNLNIEYAKKRLQDLQKFQSAFSLSPLNTQANIPNNTQTLEFDTSPEAQLKRRFIGVFGENKAKQMHPEWYGLDSTSTESTGDSKSVGDIPKKFSIWDSINKIENKIKGWDSEKMMDVGTKTMDTIGSLTDMGLVNGHGQSDWTLNEQKLFNTADTINSLDLGPIGNAATTIGTNFLKTINSIGAGKTNQFSADKDILSKASTYNVSDIIKAEDQAGKSIGLFGNRGKLNKQINKAQDRYNRISGIVSAQDELNDIVTGGMDLSSQLYKQQKQGVNFLKNQISQFKEGGIIDDITIEEIPVWIFVESKETIESFKNGGEVNVIPNGAFHKNLHHMDLEGVTKKGIPVISEEGGKIVQQAEIERDEIILRKSVTEKLEKWRKIFYNEDSKKREKDEVALKAGKLLVDEILNNTQDNTGLLNV